MKHLFSIFICTMLCSCANLEYRTANEHAYSFLGENVKTCGNVDYGKESIGVQSCILESLSENVSFFSWYWLRPVDSVPASGLLYKDGELYIAWYDSGGIVRGSHFVPKKCKSWELKLDKPKPLICNIAKGEKAYLFGLSSFVEVIENQT